MAAAGEVPIDFRPIRKNTFSFGFKVRNFGSNVKFSNLGSVDFAGSRDASGNYLVRTDTNGNRIYDNGVVGADAQRPFELTAETDAQFTKLINGGARFEVYQTRVPIDANGVAGARQLHLDPVTGLPVKIGEGLSYQDGQTRSWATNTEGQIDQASGRVAYSDYGLESSGGSTEAESGSSAGVELGFEHLLNKPHAKLQWGFGGSVGIADINAKTSSAIKATLVRRTDYYALQNAAPGGSLILTGDPNLPYSTQNQFPEIGRYNAVSSNGYFVTTNGNLVNSSSQFVNAFGELLNSSGSVVDPSSSDPALRDPVINDPAVNALVTNPINRESTVPLFNNPALSGEITRDANAADVTGDWQIKGSYYALKLGPTFRYMFNDRFAIAGRAGVSINYIGSRFIVSERVTNLPAGINSIAFNTADLLLTDGTEKPENEINKFTFGGYVGIDAEYWVSDKTGFYAGLAYENLGSYKHTYRGRVAEIGGGSGTSVRFGIITRF